MKKKAFVNGKIFTSDREKPYVVIPFEDFMEILENMHAEEIF